MPPRTNGNLQPGERAGRTDRPIVPPERSAEDHQEDLPPAARPTPTIARRTRAAAGAELDQRVRNGRRDAAPAPTVGSSRWGSIRRAARRTEVETTGSTGRRAEQPHAHRGRYRRDPTARPRRRRVSALRQPQSPELTIASTAVPLSGLRLHRRHLDAATSVPSRRPMPGWRSSGSIAGTIASAVRAPASAAIPSPLRSRLPRARVSVSAARRVTLGARAYTDSAPSETRLFHLIDAGTELTAQRDLAKLVENCARRRMDQIIA